MNNYDIVKIEPYVKREQLMSVKINSSTKDISTFIESIEDEMERSLPNFIKLKNNCFELIRRLPLPIHILKDSFVLRCQENNNGEIFNSVSRLSYNPKSDKILPGRFNLKGEAFFYSSLGTCSHDSSGQLTCILETCKEIIDETSHFTIKHFTTGKWKIIKPINTVILTFDQNAELKSHHIGNINPSYRDFISISCSQEDYLKCMNFYSLISKYASEICFDIKKYLLTTAFFHAIRQFCGEEVGILYPSAMTDNKGLNVVFSKKIIDENYLSLDVVAMYKLIRDPKVFKNYKNFPCTKKTYVDEHNKFEFKNIW